MNLHDQLAKAADSHARRTDNAIDFTRFRSFEAGSRKTLELVKGELGKAMAALEPFAKALNWVKTEELASGITGEWSPRIDGKDFARARTALALLDELLQAAEAKGEK